MKNKNRMGRFKLLPGSAFYFALLIFSLIFTQLLRNPVSSALFIFVILLPVFSLIHCLIGRSALQIYVSSEKRRAEKKEDVEYEIKITNPTFLSFPFVEAVLNEPGTDSVRCSKRNMIMSLIPFGSYDVKKTVSFKYRGLYEIGVDSLYISDAFRFFAIRAEMKNYTAISVYPRKMEILDGGRNSITDLMSPDPRNVISNDRTEPTDIKDYAPGDPVRNIHWKLSSKTQDIKVRQYSSTENRRIWVICDIARAATPPDKKDSAQILKSLRRAIEEESENEKRKRLRRAIKSNAAFEAKEKDEEAAKENGGNKKASEKRLRAKMRRRMRAGLSETRAADALAIDEIINNTIKKRFSATGGTDGDVHIVSSDSAGQTESDLKRLLEAAYQLDEIDDDVIAARFGGRLRPDAAADYDELCSDAVIEITLAAVLEEIKNNNVCTVMWYDRKVDGGVRSRTVSDISEFDEVLSLLATAECAPHESFAARIAGSISDGTNVRLKLVTSNLDPESFEETVKIPEKLGGAGSGCIMDALIFSPSDRYEDPTRRAAFTAEAYHDLSRRGMRPLVLTESTDDFGAPVFIPVL